MVTMSLDWNAIMSTVVRPYYVFLTSIRELVCVMVDNQRLSGGKKRFGRYAVLCAHLKDMRKQK